MDLKQIVLLLLVLLIAQHANALKFTVGSTSQCNRVRGASNTQSRMHAPPKQHPPPPPPTPHTHLHTLHQFTAIGTGANKGVRASVVVTINQSIRSLITDGVDSTIAPTVTYSLCVRVCLFCLHIVVVCVCEAPPFFPARAFKHTPHRTATPSKPCSKLSKAARVGYQAALFGATGTFSDPATAHAVRFGEVTAASAIPPKGFGGNAFDILPGACVGAPRNQSTRCRTGWLLGGEPAQDNTL
jgi:hypothetical protein